MPTGDEVVRVMAECEACDSVYAAREWPDGKVQPIGSDRCQCGSTDFRSVDGNVPDS